MRVEKESTLTLKKRQNTNEVSLLTKCIKTIILIVA